MDELLAKYLLGEASPEEIQSIDAWIKASDDNLKYFTHFKLIWETGELLKIESNLDVDESWAEFKQLTNRIKEEKPTAIIRPMVKTTRWLKVAAVWLLLIGIAGALYRTFKPVKANTITLQTAALVKIDTLTDGSVITLNRYTTVTYPDKFTGDTREITLNKGEAFFNIAPDKAKPFLIHVNDAVVKVVGTSFNIKTTSLNTRVIVESGIVQVIKKKVIIKLKPLETAEIDSQSGEVKKGLSTDQFYNYYRTKQLVANNTPLWRVVEVLNEAYRTNITIADKKTANRPLSTTLVIGSLDENLNVIRETFNVQIIRKGDKIIIR